MDLVSVKQRFGIIGNCEALDRALEMALRVAATDLSVLVTGESGVGKEFFPQIIHAFSARKHNVYIAVNCGAIPEGTIDSELFGHEKGAFTGATDARKGYFEEADGGTIFLDEVAELPLSTQVRLLRVLQTGEYIRVGSSKIKTTNVRVVAATNIDLRAAIANGRFREDLYYRLNTVPLHIPALRERKGDIYTLFRKFVSDLSVQYRIQPVTLDPDARSMLENYYWRGNVRQLKNVAEQISAIEESRVITPDILKKYLPEDGNITSVPVPLEQHYNSSVAGEFERELLYKMLFDMRSEIGELKTMLCELLYGRNGQVEMTDRVAGLLQAHGVTNAVAPAGGISAAGLTASNITPSEPQPTFAATEVVAEPARELTKEDVMKDAIIKALRKHNGRRKEAARDLFISERTLYRKIKDLGINEY